ncbi:SET domain-containing protein [Rhodopseudomonas palustris]|uniref:SET domain-containing protein n=1 Tax=Rhodopseudomonas palustris TaxID=1076 RepID=UPI000E5AA3AD|nr:SET domain-containing protein [Rhodopseudomonas palustris]QLH72876.1 SET domain-containing protein [Rhodopseudomonas palustris]RHZ99934.1 SET domain-containing protein [Rhodopseudomonas palustris]
MPLLSNDHYRVGRSKTGLGLFAVKPIKKGAKIIRYFGPLLDAHNKKHDGIENKYLFELNKRWTIDGSVRKNVARYINHACKPNAESDVNPRKKRVIIRAIKNIEPGEEINYDYGTDYFKAYLKPIGCKCVSCEKKRKKKAAEARVEKAKLKLKAERKAQAEAEKAARKAAKAAGKAKPEKPSKPERVAKSKAPKAVKAKAAATTKGAGKAAKTKVVTAKAGKTKAAKPAKTTSSRKTAAASKSKVA